MPPEEFPSAAAIREQKIVKAVEVGVIIEDGSLIWTEVSAAPLQLPDASCVIVTTDITERKRVEEKLKSAINEAQRFREAMDYIPSYVYMKDKDSRYIYANKLTLEMFGCTAEELTGCDDSSFFPPETVEQLKNIDSRVFSAEQTAEEIDIVDSNSGRRVYWEVKTPIYENPESKTIYGILGISTDITERKRMEEAIISINLTLEERVKQGIEDIRQKDAMLISQSRLAVMGEMINNIAHQWRQPLNALAIIIQNLRIFLNNNTLTDDVIRRSETQAMNLIMHMSHTIDDFRNFFRTGRDKKFYRINAAISKTLNLIEPSLKHYNITVIVEIKEDIQAEGVENEFNQVLLNIINNAREALTERKILNPAITIRAGAEDNFGIITVTDNAGGILPEVLPKIFDPYFTTREKGTGIGLFMSKTIVETHMDGYLTVRNTGNGVEFCIRIPLTLSTEPSGGFSR